MLVAINRILTQKLIVARRLRGNEEGAAAVEFALVSLPFFALIFAVIELGIFFFASRYLEDGVYNAGRKALTQNLSATASCTDFRDKIADNVGGWFKKSDLVISIRTVANFSSTSAPLDIANPACAVGGSNDTILIEVAYPYPFKGFRFFTSTAVIGNDMPLRAATALRVE